MAEAMRPHGKTRDTGKLSRDDFDGGPVSIDEIQPGLFLGNLTAATHMETLRSFKITHILTLDSVPLPQHILEASFLTTKFVQIADMPREDILQHLESCVDFITNALAQKTNVLVHCYFGVSRSSTAVIAYMMTSCKLDYKSAFELVKAKRRFVQPNTGFIMQLKLFRRMGCKIDPNYQRYKLHRLRLAGEQVRKAKILPQSFHNVVRPDPDVTRENPEPIVFRCRKCRRVLASKSHVLEHRPRDGITTNSSPQLNTATTITPTTTTATVTTATATTAVTTTAAVNNAPADNVTGPRLLEQIAENLRQTSLDSPKHDAKGYCSRSVLYVEPIAWMNRVTLVTQGRLHCPKCEQKVGNFSWINACQCACGEVVSPAFYLIPSKVELSKAVQNVQTTL